MFETHTQNGIVYLTADTLQGVRHGFSTRLGGVSPAPWNSLNLGGSRGDDPLRVQENYRRWCDVLDVDARRAVLSKQIHEDVVRHVTAADAGKGLLLPRDYESADALVTDQTHLPLFVFGADCNTILLYDPVRRAIGACHAGWRGTALGIAAKTVRRMTELFGCDSRDIHAALGPSIGACCFETDEDVPSALRAALGTAAEPFIEKRGVKYHIDLKGINALWLQKAGVTDIDVCPHCTFCRGELYWSHRRDGNARGVQCAMISLEEEP